MTSSGAETSALTGVITRLFEAQNQLIAAQVEAATLPPLAKFEGLGTTMRMDLNIGSKSKGEDS